MDPGHLRSGPATRSRRLAVGLILGLILVFLGLRHLLQWEGRAWDSSIMFAFGTLALTQLLAHTRRPVTTRERFRSRVVVVIAVHNEDPALLARCLNSLEIQTMLPDKVHLIDDGSSSAAARDLFVEWTQKTKDLIDTELTVQPNAGKRHAQANAFRLEGADIFCTIDSDTELDPRAIEEGLKPFSDPRVQGVAGLIMGINWKTNLLTRIIDLEFTNSFIVGRAAMSSVGSVLVTCGALAFYRASVVQDNLTDYLNQTFMGAPIRAGDDRSLSQYALMRGRVVLQESCIAFTALPERLSHLVRQRVRWNSSFYRGVVWVLRNMPVTKMAYWLTLWRAVSFLTFSMMLLITIIIAPALSGRIAWAYFVYLGVLAYLRSLRYLAFQRHDMRLRDQVITFAMAPAVALLYFFVLTPVQYYSILKVRQAKWRTRGKVEVAVEPRDEPDVGQEWIDPVANEMSVEDLTEMFPPESEREMASRYLANPVATVRPVKNAA